MGAAMRLGRRSVPLAVAAALAACADRPERDPYFREGSWRPGGANEHNLRAMLVDPRDAVRGRGAAGAEGQRAAEAVERLRSGRVRPLPASGVAEIQPTGAAGQGGAEAAGR